MLVGTPAQSPHSSLHGLIAWICELAAHGSKCRSQGCPGCPGHVCLKLVVCRVIVANLLSSRSGRVTVLCDRAPEILVEKLVRIVEPP
eukprot:6410834-Amphidinium_carterae.1